MRVNYQPTHLQHVKAILDASKANQEALIATAERVLIEGNRRERLAGNAEGGGQLTRWRYRTGPYEGKTGATLAPNGDDSLSIRGFNVEADKWTDGFRVTAGYVGQSAEILAHHAEGKAGKGYPIKKDGKIVRWVGLRGKVTGIKRDVFYVANRTLEELRNELQAIVDATFRGRIVKAVRTARAAVGRAFSAFRYRS